MTTTVEKFTLFWDGPFSQWHPSPFEIDGITYNCAEQYMMAEKARLFGDTKREQVILEAVSPYLQKKLGRQVENFDEDKWNAVCKDVVRRGTVAKFSQNEDLKKALFATAGTTLVEASPYDKIWGIGLGSNDPRAQDRSQWRGTNWLGEIITEVREEMMK